MSKLTVKKSADSENVNSVYLNEVCQAVGWSKNKLQKTNSD